MEFFEVAQWPTKILLTLGTPTCDHGIEDPGAAVQIPADALTTNEGCVRVPRVVDQTG